MVWVAQKINAKHCISSIPQELHIINFVEVVYHQADRNAHLRCDDIRRTKCGDDMQPCRADDMPLLSQWIKKLRTSFKVLNFLAVRLILEPPILHVIII